MPPAASPACGGCYRRMHSRTAHCDNCGQKHATWDQTVFFASRRRTPRSIVNCCPLAGTGHLASFHGTRGGGGVGTTPLAVSPLIELELRGKNERVARRETKRLICKLKVLGQSVTSEVGSSAEKWRKPVITDNFASDGARAKFQRPACSLRRVEHVVMVFECLWMIFRGQKFEKIIFGSCDVIDLWWPGGSMTSFQVFLMQNECLNRNQRLKLS